MTSEDSTVQDLGTEGLTHYKEVFGKARRGVSNLYHSVPLRYSEREMCITCLIQLSRKGANAIKGGKSVVNVVLATSKYRLRQEGSNI